MAGRKKGRDDGVTRIKFATLIRGDLRVTLHKIRAFEGLQRDIYEIVEDALDEYVEKHFPEFKGSFKKVRSTIKT